MIVVNVKSTKKDIKSNKRKSSITATEEQALLSSSRRPRLRTEERHQIFIFCSQHVEFEASKYGEEIDASRVEFHEFTTSILACCDLRRDESAFTVKGKIEFYNEDLPAADCVYHRSCSTNFRNNKRIPVKYRENTEKDKGGRPENQVQYEAFREVCDILELGDEEKLSIPELVAIMEEKLSDTGFPAYARRYMKKKLLDHYGDDVTVIGEVRKNDIFTYRPQVSSILRQYYDKPKEVDIELQKIRLIEADVTLIQSEIKEVVPSSKLNYPSPDSLPRNNSPLHVPPLLQLMLSKLFSGVNVDLKTAAIGQSIVQALRPRAVLTPSHIGLTTQLHQHFRSRYLIDTLHSLGFCASYKEALKFERCAALVSGSHLDGLAGVESFIKFAADNVDHNLQTLDRQNTFHGMGIIASIAQVEFSEKIVPRKSVSDKDLLLESKVKILIYREKKANVE